MPGCYYSKVKYLFPQKSHVSPDIVDTGPGYKRHYCLSHISSLTSTEIPFTENCTARTITDPSPSYCDYFRLTQSARLPALSQVVENALQPTEHYFTFKQLPNSGLAPSDAGRETQDLEAERIKLAWPSLYRSLPPSRRALSKPAICPRWWHDLLDPRRHRLRH